MRLNQVTVYSRDVEVAVAFYRPFGLEQIVASYPDYARLVCPDGGSTFSISLRPDRPRGNSATVYFECDDLDDVVAALKAKGLVFDSGPEDMRWLWREAALLDPDGNRIILFRAGDNRINPPWRLPPSDFA